MRPALVFAGCECVSQNEATIQALTQLSVDSEGVTCNLHCLYCGKETLIVEPFDEYSHLDQHERCVLNFLDTPESDFLLTLCMTGRTSSFYS